MPSKSSPKRSRTVMGSRSYSLVIEWHISKSIRPMPSVIPMADGLMGNALGSRLARSVRETSIKSDVWTPGGYYLVRLRGQEELCSTFFTAGRDIRLPHFTFAGESDAQVAAVSFVSQTLLSADASKTGRVDGGELEAAELSTRDRCVRAYTIVRREPKVGLNIGAPKGISQGLDPLIGRDVCCRDNQVHGFIPRCELAHLLCARQDLIGSLESLGCSRWQASIHVPAGACGAGAAMIRRGAGAGADVAWMRWIGERTKSHLMSDRVRSGNV